MRARIAIFILWVQAFLLVAHAFLYFSLRYLLWPGHGVALAWALCWLSVSFVPATLATWRWGAAPVGWLYTVAATWIGIACYLCIAALVCWPFYGLLVLTGAVHSPYLLGRVAFGLALAVGVYGVVNAALPRVHQVTIALEGLPRSWHGRRVVLVSDLHLGPVRGAGFLRRVLRRVVTLAPEAIFIAGDLYDGTKADVARLTRPWAEMKPPLGVFYVTGNHEEFRDPTIYFRALAAAGVRVLRNELVNVDGLQLAGLDFGSGTRAEHLAPALRGLGFDSRSPVVLLRHAPDHMPTVEAAGVGLQLSGHTHQGQLFPFTRVVKRIYGRFAYGLSHLGKLTVYVSSGTGTWGPPLRVATRPEIVLLTFENR